MRKHDGLLSLIARRSFASSVLGIAMLTVGCTGERDAQQASPNPQVAASSERKTPRVSAFMTQDVPRDMVAGQTYTVSVVMRNTGTATWTASENYRLGSVNPLDNDLWGTHRVPVPVDVPAGSEVTFILPLKAPSTPGQYNFQWRMVQEGVEWFGEETPNVLVSVAGQSAKDTK